MGHTGGVKPIRSCSFRALLAVFAAIVLVASSCSDDDGSDGDGGTATGERHEGAPEVPEECSADGGEGSEGGEGDEGGDAADSEEDDADPELLATVEERGQPDPAEVLAEVGDSAEPVDLVEGTGDEVIAEGAVEVHYSVINPADGSELESSWAVGGPVPIPLAQVFPAFAESLEGMLEGGRRAFVVPATDVLGDPPPEESGLSAGDEVLFVVDLISVSEEVEGAAATVEADEDAQSAADERGAPDVEVPEGDAETDELVWFDDVVGDGDVVCPGDTVLAHYTGIQASDGEQFDSSWDRGEPSEFSLDGVIQGWTDGLVGMKVGGRRTLVIPPDQAYGDEASGGGPSGVLVFTIDLIGVS